MAVIYSAVLPNIGLTSSGEVAGKLGRLRSDIRAAFDMAVLNRRPYRLVFHMVSGDYWLETTDAKKFYMGDHELGRDLTEEEERDRLEVFEADFEEYTELAGEEINDSDNDRKIPASSPVVDAKESLMPAKWSKVSDLEWRDRSLGPELIIQDIQTEHHTEKFTFEDLRDRARAMLYFLPSGYVERMVMHIAVRKGDMEIDQDELPFTVTTDPYLGTADMVSGYEEVELEDAKNRR